MTNTRRNTRSARRWPLALGALALLATLTCGSAIAGAAPARRAPAHQEYADDPGIQRSIEVVLDEARSGDFEPTPTTPHGSRFRMFWKSYEFTCTLEQPVCMYNGLGFMFYPTAFLDVSGFWRAVRLGIGLVATGEDKQERTTWWQHNFGMEVALAVGLQYPAVFTPYLELVIGLGALHRNIYNKDFIDFAYSFGIEAGFELFAYKHFSLGGAFGWRRSVVNVGGQSLYADSWTVSLGFGL